MNDKENLESFYLNYENRIIDFKQTYGVAITLGAIEKYVQKLRTTTNFLTNDQLPLKYRNYIIELIHTGIGNVLQLIRQGYVQYRTQGQFEFIMDKETFTREAIKKSPIPIDKTIFESLLPEDPWRQHQPKNEDEQLIHETWWVEIEKWKIESLKSIIGTPFSKSELPDPVKISKCYYSEKNSRTQKYDEQIISEVMSITANYILANPNIVTSYGHRNRIIKLCKNVKCGKEAAANWIKFYFEKAGLKND